MSISMKIALTGMILFAVSIMLSKPSFDHVAIHYKIVVVVMFVGGFSMAVIGLLAQIWF